MAQMIPEAIPAKASQGEKLLFDVLRDGLPDDFICWYEPRVKDLYPDFIILGPSFGLLILEIKGWYANRVEEANNNYFSIRQIRDGITKVETHRNPLKQAHGYFASAADKLKGYPLLCNPDGNHRGRLCFPIGTGAVMSNMTEAQSHAENLYMLLEKPAVAYRDELLSWNTLDSDELIDRLKAMFKVDFDFPALTTDQLDTIKGVLHPETAIKEVAIALDDTDEQLPASATKIVTVDIDIERLARSMKGGHRLLSGVAGSGKTQLLLSRAKILANRLLEHRILILCFNITLAAQLRSQLHEDTRNPQYKERIEVMHFHDWARLIMGSLPSPREFTDDEDYNQFLGQQVLKLLQSSPPEQRWDSVLVDEAHTFSRSWFLCCVAALKDPIDGDLLIVSDGSQSLYKRRQFTWKEVGVKAQGRSRRLTHNHRNTREILDTAWGVLAPAYDQDTDATFPAVEPDAALRHGPKPTMHVARSKAEAVDVAVERVRSLCESGYSPSDIAILYRWKSRKEAAAFDSLLSQLQELGVSPYWVTANQRAKREYSVNQPGVRIVTALSSLGLEFKVVILLWLEQFADCCNSNPEVAALARRQLYVAMTRAQEELCVVAGGKSQIGSLISKENTAEQTQKLKQNHPSIRTHHSPNALAAARSDVSAFRSSDSAP